ncbi:hypothetical protein L9F63_026748, partial [Diploptera punctata]
SMAGISGQLLTKQYFTNVMLDFKHETSLPVQAIPQALLASYQQDEPHEEPLPHDCWEIQQQGHNILVSTESSQYYPLYRSLYTVKWRHMGEDGQ